MSIYEDAARLRALQFPMGMVQQAMYELDSIQEQAFAILGDGASGMMEVAGSIAAAKAALETAQAAVANAEMITQTSADRHLGGGF